jgi:hypothetical protein
LRENAPISLDAAVAKVYALAQHFITQSNAAGQPANGYRTYTEPDKDVYITADKEKPLIAKWEGKDCGSAHLYCKGSGSSSGALVDLKLQLEDDWGPTWKKGTSPFVYHIPIDTYHSPEDKKREQQAKEQKEAAAKRDKEEKEKKEKEATAKVDAAVAKKLQEEMEKRRTQAVDTAWNKALKDKKPPKATEKAAWQKKWLEDNKNKKF